mmetsp:Transcript_21749/g.29167  ORF Transcript_21749/g.29167 Transcript_21749/m.29167 type:complete len:93 (+) Transcript_21749:474-752(+)|eukprot:CAMPEP_0185576516 /NCGR_PEP_ID=MMETSP0434-20130131/7431_1 /TAXON_ID=626734 ORGANISM="Favella taraikaensis, Strain Fe Narragansett Bay" /NCGR_SAMPLE_ID=MMETSP0434 /ASSEMBLY_ACC=CAM_ASM_000379 /LENGTH=92 /DNA_ID=CAMNT_0028193759 /DNA_START=470 /DNA_END=748 /DNA_ORIENTATION=+
MQSISWASIDNSNPTHSQVTLSPVNALAGEYTLILESFASESTLKETLKTDTITIRVNECKAKIISFQKQAVSASYELGVESLTVQLPKVTQ